MKTLITTVGTSLFTNYKNPESHDKIRDYRNIDDSLEGIEDYQAADYEKVDYKIESIEKAIKSRWFTLNNQPNTEASAEIKSILKIREQVGEIRVRLLASDSVTSLLAAQLIKQWFEQNQPDIEVDFDENADVIQDLSVANKANFEKKGLVNLVERYYVILDAAYKDYCALNITGGYKGLIPYLSIFAQLNQIPVYYLFEDTDDVLQIPQAPINLDWMFIADNSHVFKQLNDSVVVNSATTWETYKRDNSIHPAFDGYYLEEYDGKDRMFSLNALGRIAWREYDSHFFVKVPYAFKYFKEAPEKQDRVRQVIFTNLKQKLDALTDSGQDFETFHDEDLKHHKIGSTWLLKLSNIIRLQYQYIQEKRELIVYNYYFMDTQSHNYYRQLFEENFKQLKDSPLTVLTLKKTA